MDNVSHNTENKGGITMPLFRCIFNGDMSVDHFTYSYDQALYEQLGNLYAVCIADTRGNAKTILGGFIVKTSHHHDDEEFSQALQSYILSAKDLGLLTIDSPSMLPALVHLKIDRPLTEEEMLDVIMQQAMKHGHAGF